MRQRGKELNCSRSHGHHVVFPGVSCFLCKELDKIISEMHARTQLQNFIKILGFHVVRLLLPPGSVSLEPVTFLCDSWVFEAYRGTFYNATVSVHGQVSLTTFHPWASTDWAGVRCHSGILLWSWSLWSENNEGGSSRTKSFLWGDYIAVEAARRCRSRCINRNL